MNDIIFQAAATQANTAAAAELTTQLKSIGVTADIDGGLLTIPAVYQYAQEHTAAETAAYCRLSLRTYQRRVAEYKKLNIWSATGGEQYKYF